MALTAKELVSGFLHLASLPAVVIRVNEILDSPHYSAQDVGDVISKDPAMSVRLLKIVNSPFYGFTSSIDTISRAITIIGIEDLRDIIFSSSVATIFKGVPNDLVDMETFWRHSIYCAVIARLLASHLQLPNRERYFLSGLLHDIGALVIYHRLPELAREALSQVKFNDAELTSEERKLLGFDHAQVGAELLRNWRLPENLITAVENHHNSDYNSDHQAEVQITYLANCIANNTPHARSSDTKHPALDSLSWTLPGLSLDILRQTMIEAESQFEQTLHMLFPPNSKS